MARQRPPNIDVVLRQQNDASYMQQAYKGSYYKKVTEGEDILFILLSVLFMNGVCLCV